MTDTIIGAIIGVGGAIIGAILAGPVTYYFSKVLVQTTHQNALELMHQQDFSNACETFTNAFIDELIKLEVEGKDAYVDILRPAIQKHKTAVHIFRKAIRDKDRRTAFNKAWGTYYENEHQPNSPLRQYATQLEQTDGIAREERRPLAIARIKTLLKFAENE